MRIRSFHIDAFGTLRDVTVEGLPEAGAVFLGHNEAGKSTLLDFFRSTLVGYPRTRDARERGAASAAKRNLFMVPFSCSHSSAKRVRALPIFFS